MMNAPRCIGPLLLLWGLFWMGLIPKIIAQEAEEQQEKKWSLQGYIKDLIMVNMTNGLDAVLVDNLVHNRLNFKWYPMPSFNAYVEVRNRIFYGDLVKALPNYSALIDVNDDYLDLSMTVIDQPAWVVHTMLDRAYVEWFKKDWEVRAGRQRINWGKNLVWNPNDLFNAYSFFDFDYEERPGSDAIRVRRFTGFASSIEVASSVHQDFDQMVVAGLWQVNRWNYDFQFLAGKAREDIAWGIGWAGNIQNAGFKGEITYFLPYTSSLHAPTLLSSLSADYSFESSLYLHGSMLFNSDGSYHPQEAGFFSVNTGRISARNLSPYRFSFFGQSSYQFHPLFTGGIATIYFPGDHAIFVNPSVTLSLQSNWEVECIGQWFWMPVDDQYKALAQWLFLRLRWSF